MKNYLPHMTSPEVADLLTRTDMVILPVASLEQHGLQGPIGTDFLSGLERAKLIAQKTEVEDRNELTNEHGHQSDGAGPCHDQDMPLDGAAEKLSGNVRGWHPISADAGSTHRAASRRAG